jgi:hypothetical protein
MNETASLLYDTLTESEDIVKDWISEDGLSEAHKTQLASLCKSMMASMAIAQMYLDSGDPLPPHLELLLQVCGYDDILDVVAQMFQQSLVAAFQMGRASVIPETK